MKKIKKRLILMIISIILISPYAYALRVPINKDYSELDEAMLSEMSVPKLMGEIGSDYEKYLYLLKKFCLNIAKQQEIEESDIGNYVRLRKKLSRLLQSWNTKVNDLWINSRGYGSALSPTSFEGNKYFTEWKELQVGLWTDGIEDTEKKIPFMVPEKFNFEGHTFKINHLDVFIKMPEAEQFVYLRHIHDFISLKYLLSLIPLKGVVRITSYDSTGSKTYPDGNDERSIDKRRLMMQIDASGIFSIPAVDEYMARTTGNLSKTKIGRGDSDAFL